jgi:hypothetical protein
MTLSIYRHDKFLIYYLEFLLRIQEVPDMNFSHEPGYSDGIFVYLSLSWLILDLSQVSQIYFLHILHYS